MSRTVPASLPDARVEGAYAIAVVCLGNICRSPIADVVLADRIAGAGLDHQVHVASAGTGGWHVGEAMDERAATALRAADLDPTQHRARQFDTGWLERFDLVLAMDEQNLDDIGGRDQAGRVRLFRDFDPVETGGEVPDPYYGGDDGFDAVLAMIERTANTLVELLEPIFGDPQPTEDDDNDQDDQEAAP